MISISIIYLKDNDTEKIKYICPPEDVTVCTCKSLLSCNPIAEIVQARKFNELKAIQVTMLLL